MKINQLTYIKDILERDKNGHILIEVVCDCGNNKIVRKSKFLSGVLQSCGCIKEIINFNRRKQIENGYKPEGSLLTFIEDLGQGKVKCSCDCGNTTEICKVRFMQSSIKSCGCLKHRRGVNNPRYKGTLSKYDTIRKSVEYDNWRRECFERDNYTCQISGKKINGDGVVHHLEPFHKLIVNVTEDDFIDYYPLWDINNGVTLCKDIHKAFHNKYGYENFTKEDYIEFSNSKG